MAALLQPAPRNEAEIELLDLRHFSGAELAPLLRDEARRWQQRHRWDYTRSTDLLLDYLDSRLLPGLVALGAGRRLLGYTFCVYEADKAVVGDVYAFGEAADRPSPVCARLLDHLLETLTATPGIRRIESQLLMMDAGVLDDVFAGRGFSLFPRNFMLASLDDPPLTAVPRPFGPELRALPWQAESYAEAAELIKRCYADHGDSRINDQYQSTGGAERFLQNIVRFPGCGAFDPSSSLLLRDTRTHSLQGMILCSRVRSDAAHITQLCINPALRGMGLGHALLQHAAQQLRESHLRTVSLTVTEANRPARALYESLGFRALHRFQAATWEASAD